MDRERTDKARLEHIREEWGYITPECRNEHRLWLCTALEEAWAERDKQRRHRKWALIELHKILWQRNELEAQLMETDFLDWTG